MPHKRGELSKKKEKAPLAPQKPNKAARVRAIGLIGLEKVQILERAGLMIVDKEA